MSLKDASFLSKAVLSTLLVALILYSCEALNSSTPLPDDVGSATPSLAERDGVRAIDNARAQPGSGTLVENGGQERVFQEIACQALYDRQGYLRGYLAVFEETSANGLGLRILLRSEDQAEPSNTRVYDGVYNASVRWYAEQKAFYSELTLKNGGKAGSLWTSLGTFHFRCGASSETDRYRNRRGPYERPDWLRSFERCDQLGPDPLPFWKRWLCEKPDKD